MAGYVYQVVRRSEPGVYKSDEREVVKRYSRLSTARKYLEKMGHPKDLYIISARPYKKTDGTWGYWNYCIYMN